MPLINSSYDGLWLFGSRTPTNKVTFVMMDEDSYETFHQKKNEAWDRGLHAQLVNKLADDDCSMVVMNIFLGQEGDPEKDQELVRAMQRHKEIALRTAFKRVTVSDSSANHPVMPSKIFLSAAGKRWGVSRFLLDSDLVVRRFWPVLSPGKFPSLAETAARTSGAVFDGRQRERWLRYYGSQPQWTRISYALALKEPANFFQGQTVFLGIAPKTLLADGQPQKLRTPYTRWTDQDLTATEMLITEFLNLVNNESLRRSGVMDFFGLLIGGAAIGAVLPRFRLAFVIPVAVLVSIVVLGLAVTLSAKTNYWFPWMLVVGGQLPIVLVWTVVASRGDFFDRIGFREQPSRAERAPTIPGYSLVEPAFGHGAYGKVWLAQNKSGEWRAIKVVSSEPFEEDHSPYDREYEGVSRYREICDKHPGLLRVEFVSEKWATHFYYVMELGDALEPGWETQPTRYKPRDLNRVRSLAPQKRLPISECVRIGMELSETLDFLHSSGFTHRDIKPQNILLVSGRPKLADLGLITTIRISDQTRTAVGTPGYMPPVPEMPGTRQADIYALGMVLYVISTGRSPALFPELSETLLGEADPTGFLLLNSVVLKACQPDPKDRYGSARELYCALETVRAKVVKPVAG